MKNSERREMNNSLNENKKSSPELKKQSNENLQTIKNHLAKDLIPKLIPNNHYNNAHEFMGIIGGLIQIYKAPYIYYSIGGGEFNLCKKDSKERITFDRDLIVLLDSENFSKVIINGFLKLINETSIEEEKQTIDNSIGDLLHRIEGIVETLKLDEKYFTYDRIGYSVHQHRIIRMYVINTDDNKAIDLSINILKLLDSKNLVRVIKDSYISIINITPVIPHEGDHTYLPSRFKHEEEVVLNFPGHHKIEGCKVHAIHFTVSKVKYDLNIPLTIVRIGEKSKTEWTRIYNVDSCFVEEIESSGTLVD